ncbi:tyrosine-type recombinase/integrase [Methylomonas methanica]|uniref:tyrosine-type recombinase/integrase n=1 Tax=Methylomonas methanica TaxID=421 RepID=UPI000674AEA2|nr:tyrosine-type recombinase/integrase [Methylomonas methanica]
MSYLTTEQVRKLMGALEQSTSDAYIVALVCLSTGCRWREAQHLALSDIRPGLVTFGKTKSKKARSVPISAKLYTTLHGILSHRRLTDCYTSFSRVLGESGIDLPEGQRTHVLRHTFASHFMMNRGNILTLQKVLGHTSLEMTMRYAHLSPDYLQEVLEKNPALTIGCQNEPTQETP